MIRQSAHTRPPSPLTQPPGQRGSAPVTRHTHTSKSHSMSAPTTRSNPQPERRDRTLPVLHWLTGKHMRTSPGSHSRSPTPSRPKSPRNYSPTGSGPSSPASDISALADALHDDPHLVEAHSSIRNVAMPCRPEAACLPDAFRASRPPTFLSSLTRSTLPTAGLSPPPTITSFFRSHYTDPFRDPFVSDPERSPDTDMFYSPTPKPVSIPHTPAPVHLAHSPPTLSTTSTRSSIDSLRSIQRRGLHTQAPSQSGFPFANPLRGWFNSEEQLNKDNANSLLNEDDSAESSEAIANHIRKKYYSPKNPIVFCHGLLGFDTVTVGPSIAPFQVSHWRGITDVLEANGIEVFITRVPATSSPIDRAHVLEKAISAKYPGRSVHLIGLGHSMGGLDCRYMTTHLTKRTFKVLSITTIATPHRGSSFADHFLNTVGPSRMPSVLSLLDLLPNGGGDGKAFEFLTVENMRKFNEDTPDVAGVQYFSWGAVYEPGLIDTWKWSHSVILEKEGPNDGLVSRESARWGTYLGTLEDVNHLDLVGWINTARYKWAEIMGREIKFKPATFYLSIADHLARVVEGQGEVPVITDRSKDVQPLHTSVRGKERENTGLDTQRTEMMNSLRKGDPSNTGENGTDSKSKLVVRKHVHNGPQ